MGQRIGKSAERRVLAAVFSLESAERRVFHGQCIDSDQVRREWAPDLQRLCHVGCSGLSKNLLQETILESTGLLLEQRAQHDHGVVAEFFFIAHP